MKSFYHNNVIKYEIPEQMCKKIFGNNPKPIWIITNQLSITTYWKLNNQGKLVILPEVFSDIPKFIFVILMGYFIVLYIV